VNVAVGGDAGERVRRYAGDQQRSGAGEEGECRDAAQMHQHGNFCYQILELAFSRAHTSVKAADVAKLLLLKRLHR